MKDGYIAEKSLSGSCDEDIELINKLSRRKLSADEVYTFKMVLCDNEIDRDCERFSVDALNALSGMFVGKTGIFDHSMRASDQFARIYKTYVEKQPGALTLAGEEYCRLIAHAYMPRTIRTEELINEIDTGIKKEISVGCSVGRIVCSVCGADIKKCGCEHLKGESYQGGLCHHILDAPTDAYEWSFVAVPAQKGAGVIKSYEFSKKPEAFQMNSIIKSLATAENDIILSPSQARNLADKIKRLQQLSEDGKEYRDHLKKEVIRLCALSQPEIDPAVMESIADKMSMHELKSMQSAFKRAGESLATCGVQLAGSDVEKKVENINYII